MTAQEHHPDPEQLRAFCQGRLSPADLAMIQDHLAQCATCCLAAEEAASDDSFIARLRKAGHNEKDQQPTLSDNGPPPHASAVPTVLAWGHRPPESEAALPARPTVPGYEIFEELGRGGMGIVYKARQLVPERIVALKFILTSEYAGVADRARFRREADATARLQHPGIVAIHHAGECSLSHGVLVPYLVLEYVAGQTLAHRLGSGSALSPAEAATLVEQLARAVQHAHERGIIHRDLKPGNVLLTHPDAAALTTPVGDTRPPKAMVPKITDFGLAKSLDQVGFGGPQTLSGVVMGTPSYMAPEQAAGRGNEVGPAADVYALGAILYECLTGRPPFQAGTPMETMLQVIRDEPLPPRSLCAKVPRDLETICLTCLRKPPQERYPSSEELAEDLRRFRDGEAIWALGVRCQKTTADGPRPARRQVLLRLLGVLAGLIVLLIVLLLTYNGRPAAEQLAGLSTSESPAPELPNPDRPTRLWLLHDKPDDLLLFTGEGSAESSSSSVVPVERILVEPPTRAIPPGLPLPVWPTPRPVLIVHSLQAWGFVHPLVDSALGQRVAKNWPMLLRMALPPQKNLVKAGGFDGDCLATNHRGNLWRVGDTAGWTTTRQITLNQPSDKAGGNALLLTNLDPAQSTAILGCYQPLAQAAPAGAIVVLRYRARSQRGKGSLAVYASMPVLIPDNDRGAAAKQIRSFGVPLPSEVNEPVPNRWMYWSPAWVTPTDEWQTYLVISECPPFPTRVLHRNLVIDLRGTDQVWVDDVELFVWQPGSNS